MATYFFWKAIRETHWDFGWIAGMGLSCGLVGFLVICFVAMLVHEWRRNRPFPDGPVETAACVGGVMWFFSVPIAIDLLPFYGLYRLFRHLAESRGKGVKDKLYEANLKVEELERKLEESKRKFSELQDEYATLKAQTDEKTNGEEVGDDGYVVKPVYVYRYYFREGDRAEAANRMLSAIEGGNLHARYVVDYNNNSRETYAKVWFNPLKHKRCEIQRFLAEHFQKAIDTGGSV